MATSDFKTRRSDESAATRDPASLIDVELIGAPAFTVTVSDGAFVYTGVNRRLTGLVGIAPSDSVGRAPRAILPAADADEVESHYRLCVDQRRAVDFEMLFETADGSRRCWHTTVSPVFAHGDGGPVTHLIGIAVDVTQRKAAERHHREAEARLSLAMDVLEGGFWYYDIAAGSFRASPQLSRLAAGADVGPLDLGRYVALVPNEDRAATDLGPLIRGECDANQAEYRVRTLGGAVKWLCCRRRLTRDEAGRPVAVVGVAVDITEQKARQDGLARQAATDALTNLLNRRGFDDLERRVVERARAGGSTYGLLVIDLDRFKPVNDVHGHAVGDVVLREVAVRLRRHAGPDDAVARIGGDEFAILVANATAERLGVLSARIVEVVARPIETPAGTIAVGASVGAALHRADDRDAAALAERADAELLAVKRSGRGTWRLAA